MKRKFLIVALTFVCAVCLALGISACSASGESDSTTIMEEGVVYFTDFSIKYTSAEDSPNGDINKSTLTDEIDGSVQSYYLVMNFDMQLASNTDGLEYITVKFVVLDADVVETIIDYADTSNVSAITSDGQTTITATYSLPDKAKSVKNINLVLELNPKTIGATDIYYSFSSDTKQIDSYTDKDITYNYTSSNISISNTSLSYSLNLDGQSYSVTGIGTKSGDVKFYKETYKGLPITAIGNRAFYRCTVLTSITIPDSVTSIGDCAFEDCTALESITIPNSVTSIGDSAFENCTALKSITIPNSVTSIGESAFNNTAYYNDSNNWEDNVLYIGNFLIKADTGFSGSYTIKDGTTVIADVAFYESTALESITIPNSVTSVGDSAFYNCTMLTSITIPDSVTSIGGSAFKYCTALTSITIGNGVTSIGDDAFCVCRALESITIPDSVTSIGGDAFMDCTSLTSITIGSGVTSIGANAFSSTAYYIDKNNWENNVLYIGNYLIEAGNSISGGYTIKDGTTIIASCAFWGSTALESVTIPDSVTSIGEGAFRECTALTSINVDSGNTAYKSIEGNLYSYDGTTFVQYAIGKNDTSFTIPDGVKTIYISAFSYCTALTSITIPDNVTSIGSSAFSYCTSLKSITIPDSVTSIGYRAFSGCSKLTRVTFENTSGWYLSNGTTISSSKLSDTSTAAKYLISTYCEYFWYRS